MEIVSLGDFWEVFQMLFTTKLGLTFVGLIVVIIVLNRIDFPQVMGGWREKRKKRRPKTKNTQKNWDLEILQDLSPEGFEEFVTELFRRRGYKASRVGTHGDHGVDILLRNPNGERELVQCKNWKNKWVGEKEVRDFYGALTHDEEAVRGYIVTTNYFSEPARKWASGKPIDLIDADQLIEAVAIIERQKSLT